MTEDAPCADGILREATSQVGGDFTAVAVAEQMGRLLLLHQKALDEHDAATREELRIKIGEQEKLLEHVMEKGSTQATSSPQR